MPQRMRWHWFHQEHEQLMETGELVVKELSFPSCTQVPFLVRWQAPWMFRVPDGLCTHSEECHCKSSEVFGQHYAFLKRRSEKQNDLPRIPARDGVRSSVSEPATTLKSPVSHIPPSQH